MSKVLQKINREVIPASVAHGMMASVARVFSFKAPGPRFFEDQIREAALGLELYNTLTRKKAPFEPIDPKNVRMYVCGPTVYDFAHIGNARPVIVFDVLFRLLRHIYGEGHVTYVRNITDVDDKINARALRDFPGLPLNEAIARVTEKTANQFHADVEALGCLPPTHEPRATDNIAEMIAIIESLLSRGHAYVAAGEVLFDCASMSDYGALSRRNLDEQQAGARVEVEAHKKNPADFVLWKLSSPEEPGWESPWGRGRPGWHIECSAMSDRYLWQEVQSHLSAAARAHPHQFDIHGGGLDLIFPHHENEIAQSRCAHGTAVMANVWMHNGFLQVEGEKMSKSLGNFVTINELLETEKFGGQKWHGKVVRLAMMMTQYRQPIDWTTDRLFEAREKLYDWNLQCFDAPTGSISVPYEIIQPLSDDLNTTLAISGLHSLSRAIRWASIGPEYVRAAGSLRVALEFLGLYEHEASINLLAQDAPDAGLESKVGELIAARLEARKRKDFKESDRIRDELAKMGIALKDSKNKETGEIETTWEVMR